MKNELLKKWLNALRSGKYKQASGELISVSENKRYENGAVVQDVCYCAMGLLAEVAGEKKEYDPESNTISFKREYDCIVSDRLLRKVGMPSDMQDEVTCMNDEGISFKKIANFLEKKLAA